MVFSRNRTNVQTDTKEIKNSGDVLLVMHYKYAPPTRKDIGKHTAEDIAGSTQIDSPSL